jgi:two-component system chemotaxis sensor kinase CheA
MGDSEALHKELMETFQIEARDHLDALGSLLVALESEERPGERAKLVESIFRRMHTLKGAAHAVNFGEIAGRCQDLESLLADLKRGDLQLEVALFDRLHREVDLIAARVFARPGGPFEASEPEPAAALSPTAIRLSHPFVPAEALAKAGAKGDGGDLAQGAASSKCATELNPPKSPFAKGDFLDPAARAGNRAAAPGAGEPGAAAQPRESSAEKTPAPETVRVPARLLESLLLQAEELVSAKLTASVLAEQLSAATGELAGRGTARSRALELAATALRGAAANPAAARLAGALQDFCEAERRAETRLRALERGAERNLWALGGMIDPLLQEMKKLQLLPFATLSTPFSKVIRDLARELGKEAEMVPSGGEIEIDRRILAELKEPLLHIVRNVMDHGIEKAQQREGCGKPARGRIVISLRLLDANHAELTIADDGRGIDPAQVRGTALRLELITPETAGRLSDAEALQLVFESGFSTSAMITSLSGRGVGLAIVRESLERLGGHVTVESRPGLGTEFRLVLPLSFALIRGLQVETGGRVCILPAANVEMTARLPREEIRSVENRDTVLLGQEVFSLVSLAALLELGNPGPAESEKSQQVVLIRVADKRIACAVDQVIGVREVLVKPLGKQLSRVRNVSGATVLGDGSVVPILNVNDLARSALLDPARGAFGAGQASRTRPRRLCVLVAEDSITSRTLLKNILESSGFQVATAIDGADALAQLKTGSFDVVVSDVEMPRLDGFGLTAAIRADQRCAALPVILVTGLESRADRERGIEVGANAYVVKSSFDQSSLIEVIQKLTGT